MFEHGECEFLQVVHQERAPAFAAGLIDCRKQRREEDRHEGNSDEQLRQREPPETAQPPFQIMRGSNQPVLAT